MSGVAIINYKLANDAALTAVVPSARIFSGIAPINTPRPTISISQVSGFEYPMIKRGTRNLMTERVQITVHGQTYVQKKEIIKLIRAALPSVRGTVNGIKVDSITPGIEGPDMEIVDPDLHDQPVDYLVKYIR